MEQWQVLWWNGHGSGSWESGWNDESSDNDDDGGGVDEGSGGHGMMVVVMGGARVAVLVVGCGVGGHISAVQL